MSYAITIIGKLGDALSNPLAWLAGFGLAVLGYLLGEPGAAFYALWTAVAMDLLSRLISESVQHGGFWKAIREGHIQSDKALAGAKVKIPAYFIMCVFAAQTMHFPYEYAYVASSIIYGIFFFVELESTCENFIEAGVEEFSWLKRFSKRKLEQMVEDGENSGSNEPLI
ncbi:phage holin family protein [Syntrophomonas curvata]